MIVKDERLRKIGNLTRMVIGELCDDTKKYEALSREINISADTIKQFVSRTPKRNYQSRNRTLQKLYLYIDGNYQNFPPLVKSIVDDNLDVFNNKESQSILGVNISISDIYARTVDHGYDLIYKMLHVQPRNIDRLDAIICGQYVCYFLSPYDTEIRISFLSVRAREANPDIFEFEHIMHNRLGEARVSDGIIIPLDSQIYMSGDIESGQGLESLCFEMPLSREFSILKGMMISLGSNRQPFMSKAALLKLEKFTHKTKHSVPISDLTDFEKEFIIPNIQNDLNSLQAVTL